MIKPRESLNIRCENCFHSQLCLVRGLFPEELHKLNKLISKIHFMEKGAHIFRRNDDMMNLYAVYSGAFKDYWIDQEGTEHIDNFYFPGDVIGLESIPRKKHLFSAVALKSSQLCAIPLDAYLRHVMESKNSLQRFINVMSYKMQNDSQICFTTNVRQRIANFILNIYYRIEERGLRVDPLFLPMSQIDVASFLGMAYETLSRILHEFQTRNLITLQNKEICIVDIEQLRTLAKSSERVIQV